MSTKDAAKAIKVSSAPQIERRVTRARKDEVFGLDTKSRAIRSFWERIPSQWNDVIAEMQQASFSSDSELQDFLIEKVLERTCSDLDDETLKSEIRESLVLMLEVAPEL